MTLPITPDVDVERDDEGNVTQLRHPRQAFASAAAFTTPEALAEAILRFEALEDGFEPGVARAHARRFDATHFREGLRFEVDQLLEAHASRETPACASA